MAKGWKPLALVLATFLLAVSVKNDFIYFLLGLELMLELGAFCQASWLAKKVSVRVVLPQTRVLRGETFQIQAELTNRSRFPIPQLMVRLAVRAYPEREALLLKGKLMLDSAERGSVCFQLDGSHCVCLEIRPDQLVVTDFLGLFQRRCRVDTQQIKSVFLLPQALGSQQISMDAQNLFPREDGSSETRGSEAADISEIRSYREGDNLKLVHWKLTARLNELMVRELTDAAQKLTWLYLNLQERADQPQVRRDPNRWDHFVETVSAVSASLLKMEKPHMVIWYVPREKGTVRYEVFDENGLREMLCALLRADSYAQREDFPLLKEIAADETKGTWVEIDLQGNFARTEMPG